MILFLASLDTTSYEVLLKVFEEFEKGKLSKKKKGKHQAMTSKPNCAGSQFKGERTHSLVHYTLARGLTIAGLYQMNDAIL